MGALFKGTTVAMLVLSLGLHWVLLQGLAWTGMVIGYSQNDSLKNAVEKTFDGQHPCAFCKAIQSGKQQEQEQASKSTVKLDAGIVWEPVRFLFGCVTERVAVFDRNGRLRADEPPKPHPRLSAASSIQA